MCLRTDAHPAFVAEGGVDVLVRLIEFQSNRTIQRLAVAAIADVIPYFTVKAIDDPKMDKQLLVGALVSLLRAGGASSTAAASSSGGTSAAAAQQISDDQTLCVLSVDSLCRLCVVPSVQHYVLSSTPTLDLLLAYWKAALDPLKLSILSFFAKVADHPKLAHMLLERGGLDDIIALGHRTQLKFRTKVARLLCLLANKDGMRVPLAQRGGLKLLLALRSGAANDQKVKAYALEGVFAILENQEILAQENVHSEIAQLMLSLSQIGGSTRIKAAASAIVVRMAAKEAGGGTSPQPKGSAAAAANASAAGSAGSGGAGSASGGSVGLPRKASSRRGSFTGSPLPLTPSAGSGGGGGSGFELKTPKAGPSLTVASPTASAQPK